MRFVLLCLLYLIGAAGLFIYWLTDMGAWGWLVGAILWAVVVGGLLFDYAQPKGPDG